MIRADVIVVGAGASGLMIAKKLSEARKKVIVLEARDRVGGRIESIGTISLQEPIEGGAEFMHGDLPVTIALLKEAGMKYRVSGGESWQFRDGKLTKDDELMGGGDLLASKLAELKEDLPVADFLETYFAGDEYEDLREMVRGFVEGYDAADTKRASSFSLQQEWEEMSEGDQYHVNGGYTPMIEYLHKQCIKNDCEFVLSNPVKQISWQPGSVSITTANQLRYTANKVVVTVPLGILCASANEKAAIEFSPALTDKQPDFEALGYGGVIKIALQFSHAFWRELKDADGKSLKNMGWLFSDEDVPTWWTQAPGGSSLLTGWLAGPKAGVYKDASDELILNRAIASVCSIFQMSKEELQKMIVFSKVFNWVADPFSLGAYSYATPASREAIKRAGMPVANTLYFAGEAFYQGEEIGTVEAALANGQQVAEQVLEV